MGVVLHKRSCLDLQLDVKNQSRTQLLQVAGRLRIRLQVTVVNTEFENLIGFSGTRATASCASSVSFADRAYAKPEIKRSVIYSRENPAATEPDGTGVRRWDRKGSHRRAAMVLQFTRNTGDDACNKPRTEPKISMIHASTIPSHTRHQAGSARWCHW